MLKTFVLIEAKEINCESVSNSEWDVGFLMNCWMQSKTVINETNVELSIHNQSITGLNFDGNKNISLLPIRVYQNFPNLLAYSAASCSLKVISKANFINLTKLKQLRLFNNQLEKIPSDAFEDLESLDNIILCKNFSKSIPDFQATIYKISHFSGKQNQIS